MSLSPLPPINVNERTPESSLPHRGNIPPRSASRPHRSAMGSDIAARASPLELSSQARARRSLAAARAARDGISTMVDALRISKPPRAPLKPLSSSVPAARKHALIPHAEGRVQMEARIRALEDAVAARDAELVKLKRQWGRALVRRKHVEKERDNAREQVREVRESVRCTHAVATAERKRTQRVLEDVTVPLPALREAADRARATAPQLAEEVLAAVDDIEETLAEASEEVAAHPLPVPAADGRDGIKAVAAARSRSYAGSVATEDEDGKSVASYASSTAFGDDRELQVDALVELVEILDAKLVNGPPNAGAAATLSRAKRTLNGARVRGAVEVKEIVAERDKLSRQLEAVMKEKETVGGEDAALALAARAEAELRDANKEMQAMRERLRSLEKIAERGFRSGALNERNTALEGELRSAKKTVGRLVQERNSLRRTAPSSMLSNASNASKTPGRGNSEAMKRILDWRQRASSENHERSTEPVAPVPFMGLGSDHVVDEIRPLDARVAIAEPLPDRVTGRTLGNSIPVKKRRMGMLDSESANANDVVSLSERSLDVGVNDSISAQSLPVQGFLRRHDSFLSGNGNVSASGDEITFTSNRNIFSSRDPKIEDGLLALLGGS